MIHKIRVAEIAEGGQVYNGRAHHDCLGTAHTDGVLIVQPRAGDVWRTSDGLTLTFIGPSLPFIGGRNAINDNSVAFILQYAQFSMLFTGDAGVAAEQCFLAEGVDLSATVPLCFENGFERLIFSCYSEKYEAVRSDLTFSYP